MVKIIAQSNKHGLIFFFFDRHMWLSRLVQEPPTEMNYQPKKWWGEPIPNFSGTPKAFRTYSTTKPKLHAWEPVVRARQ
jgi:NADH:ubiquinone oxidoreductase subunit